MTVRLDILSIRHTKRFARLHIFKLPPHISTRRLGIKSNRRDTLSSGITIITVSQDLLMIGHNIWVTRLDISKLPLNILTNRPSIKVNRHNVLSR